LESAGSNWVAAGKSEAELRFCANAEYDACNWLIPLDSHELLCASCRHNRTIPDLTDAVNLSLWQKLEMAKHHLFYGLLRLRLPLETRQEKPEYGLAFDVLVDDPGGPGGIVQTGHQNGVITLNLAEADDAIREKRRTELGEPYRTLLGHFRHEIAHYYWDRLVRDNDRLSSFRTCFGDERQDYDQALKTYYAEGPPADWRGRFVSAYASAHPWEDFAETWAHFLHIVDTLEMAGVFRRGRLRPVRHRQHQPTRPPLASDRGRGEQHQSLHGPAGSLPIRSDIGRHSEARLCARANLPGGMRRLKLLHPGTAGGLSRYASE
jgi:hypothetical protein